jgi:hypothetical protein
MAVAALLAAAARIAIACGTLEPAEETPSEDDGGADSGEPAACTIDRGDGAPTVIASAQYKPGSIAVDPAPCGAGSIFIVNKPCDNDTDASLVMMQKDGAIPSVYTFGCIISVTTSSTQVAWAAYTEVGVAAIDGGDRGNVALGGQNAYSVSIDNDHVYWSSLFSPEIRGRRIGDPPCTDDSCTLFLTTDKGGTTGIAVEAGTVFFGERDAATLSASADGSNLHVYETGGTDPRSFVFTNDYVYWIASGEIHRAPRGGNPASIITGQVVTSMTIAGDRLYWTTDNGLVRSSNANGQDVRDIASGGGYLSGIAADGTAIYWIDRDLGQVVRAFYR